MKSYLLKWKQNIENFFKKYLDDNNEYLKKMDEYLNNFLTFVSEHTRLIITIAVFYIFSLSILGLLCESYECHLFGFGSMMENLTKRIDHVTIWLAGLTFLFTSRIWQRELQDNQEIKIKLICKKEDKEDKEEPEKFIYVPYEPIRKQCTRAEVQGILGNFYRMGDDKKENQSNQLENQTPVLMEEKAEQGHCRYPNHQNNKQSDNYNTAGVSSPAYFKNLKEVELGNTDELVIYFSKKDWNKFKENIDKFNNQ